MNPSAVPAALAAFLRRGIAWGAQSRVASFYTAGVTFKNPQGYVTPASDHAIHGVIIARATSRGLGHRLPWNLIKGSLAPRPAPRTRGVLYLELHTMAQFVASQAGCSDDDTPSDEELLIDPAEWRAPGPVHKARWSGKHFLITYAQCPEDPDDIFTKLDNKRKIERAVGCIELHEDGNPHVHIALVFEKKLNTTDCRYFDYAYGSGYQSYHPNFSTAKNWPACINYCRGKKKELVKLYQWRCTFQEALDTHTAERAAAGKPNLFEECRKLMPDREAWIQWCYEHNAAQFMREVWDECTRPPISSIDTAMRLDGKGPTYDPSLEWRALPETFTKSVVLIGPSGCGKTTWAVEQLVRRFGVGLLCNHTDDLRKLDVRVHKFILFDEIRFNGGYDGKGAWPLEKQVSIVDTALPRSIHARYGCALIPPDFPKLFTAAERMPFENNYQVTRRIQVINLYPDSYDIWLGQ